MSQNYTPTKWIDDKTVGTASVMNNMEKGIEDAHNRINGVDSQIKKNTSRIEVLENIENSTSIDVIDDENISADKTYSSNKITEITNGLSTRINDNKRRLDELQLTGGTDGIVFDTFPSDEVLNSLPMNSTFEVKGFYEVGDMPRCAYLKTWYAQNSIKKNEYYVKPIGESNSVLFLPQIGIRTGEEYAVQNSSALSQIEFGFSVALKLPIGDYYFDRPIDLRGNQMSLIGECTSFTGDHNAKGITLLVFPNLAEGEYAINIGTGTISNVTIRGNANHYDYYIDRTQTYINKDNIEQEVCVRKCYGLYNPGGTISTIFNVHVENFYWGANIYTGNIYIDNFFVRRCHIGLAIGGDTKCKGVYAWDVHTVLQMNRSISSVVQVRADSCHHLVHIYDYLSGIQLTDLDADYCIGSVIKIGNHNEWCSVKDIVINGITGRGCCYNSYDSAKDTVPTSANITNKADVSHWGFISVENYSRLDGAIITMAHNVSSNPHDGDSTLRTPSMVLAVAGTANVLLNTTYSSGYGSSITRQTLLNNIKSFPDSADEDPVKIALNTPTGVYYYQKSYTTITTNKQATETLN